MGNVFTTLGLSQNPIMLAPLAGVSDHPFRRICQQLGAELSYVEMLSATALVYRSQRTFDMLTRHAEEGILGVQLTAKTADEMGRAVALLDEYPFETIDLNMGCPVQKVVKSGAGSAILREPERVYETVKAACQNTDRPVSVKIRRGWDARSLTALEVAEAAQAGGARWLTIHGRLRSDDYGRPVDLGCMAALKKRLTIPVVGNGNLFSVADAVEMCDATGVDGIMISRGALGNPWIFRDLGSGCSMPVCLDEWQRVVIKHLRWQRSAYGDHPTSAVCMRKHLLWYLKGWPGVKDVRQRMTALTSLDDAERVIDSYYEKLLKSGVRYRENAGGSTGRFQWDPKWDMDRRLDRGVASLSNS